jgi:hypothetical protein
VSTLRCAADNSEIVLNLPAAANFTGTYLLGGIFYPRAIGAGLWASLIGHHTSGVVANLALEIDSSGRLEVNQNNGASPSHGTTVITTNAWWELWVSKATGTTTPRFHIKNLTTAAAWIHENGNVAIANPPSQSGGTIRIGEWANADDYDGNIAVVGGSSNSFTDLQVEAFSANLRTSDIAGSTPAMIYVNELTSQTSIPDLMGNGATLNVVNGTTLDAATNPPGWTFDGTGAAAAALPPRRRIIRPRLIVPAGAQFGR